MITCNQVMKYILDRIDRDDKQTAKRRRKEEVVEQKRRNANASKLSSLLYRHKESLKTEILKKRALLDKELQLQAQVQQDAAPLPRLVWSSVELCGALWSHRFRVHFISHPFISHSSLVTPSSHPHPHYSLVHG